jgi:hypothetical protein
MLEWNAEPVVVVKELQPLLSTLFMAFEEAIQQALTYFAKSGKSIESSVFSCLVRYGVKMALDSAGLRRYQRGGVAGS